MVRISGHWLLKLEKLFLKSMNSLVFLALNLSEPKNFAVHLLVHLIHPVITTRRTYQNTPTTMLAGSFLFGFGKSFDLFFGEHVSTVQLFHRLDVLAMIVGNDRALVEVCQCERPLEVEYLQGVFQLAPLGFIPSSSNVGPGVKVPGILLPFQVDRTSLIDKLAGTICQALVTFVFFHDSVLSATRTVLLVSPHDWYVVNVHTT